MGNLERKKQLDEWMVKFDPALKKNLEAQFETLEKEAPQKRDGDEKALVDAAKANAFLMAMKAPFSISDSVGKGGKNKPTDVMAVEVALNRLMNAGLPVEDPPYARTIKAIVSFQQAAGIAKPDGLVKPGDPTALALARKAMPAADDAVRKQARKDFSNHLDMFANLWLTAATTALAGAPEAEDKESTAGWWVALAGNMLWAATCLIPGGQVYLTLIRGMSFAGAALGSGVGQPAAEKAPSGKQMISELLTKARDAMVNSAGPVMDKAAALCGEKQITDPQGQREALWGMIFNTPFDQSEPIRKVMEAKIRGWLDSYLQQWHKWMDETASQAKDEYNKASALGRFGEVASGLGGTGGLSYTMIVAEYTKRYRAGHPFKPHLE